MISQRIPFPTVTFPTLEAVAEIFDVAHLILSSFKYCRIHVESESLKIQYYPFHSLETLPVHPLGLPQFKVPLGALLGEGQILNVGSPELNFLRHIW